MIWLWRLAAGGVVPLILYEFSEYCSQRPAPTPRQKVAFILRHITVKQDSSGRWYGSTRWQNDEHLAMLRRDLEPHRAWIELFSDLRTIGAKSQTKAKAEAKRLVTAFVARHAT